VTNRFPLAAATIGACFIMSGAVAADDVAPSVRLEASSASGAPGEEVTVEVRLHTVGNAVAGVQADINIDLRLITLAKPNGRPDCVVNPEIDKASTTFSFQPPGCDPEESCDRFRAIVFSADNVDPIPDRAVLFMCTVLIADDALPGEYPLSTSLLITSNPNGQRLPSTGADGTLTVFLPPGATPKPTRTPAPTRTPTATIPATATATITPTPTLIPVIVPCGIVGSAAACTPVPQPSGDAEAPTPTPAQSPGNADALPSGTECVVGTQCNSGFCTDGVCCDAPVCPVGMVCNLPRRVGRCSLVRDPLCSLDAQCASGFCVDGHCCETRCPTGQFCDVLGHVGRCSPPLPRVFLAVFSAAAAPGEQVTVQVALHTDGVAVAGVQTDISFDAFAVVPTERNDGGPLCAVNPEINKPDSTFVFQPPGCVVGDTCTALRVLVFSVANVDPIPSGTVLFTCTAVVADDAPSGTYALTTFGRVAADPRGIRLEEFGALDGRVTVVLAPGATARPTRSGTPTPTPTPMRTPMPTRTTPETFTPWPTATHGLGSPCSSGAVCPSGFCVNDVCCDSSSCPPGEVCDAFSHAGRCGAPETVTSPPNPAKPGGGVKPHPLHKPQARDVRETAPAPSTESGCAIDPATSTGPRTLLTTLLPFLAKICVGCRRRIRRGISRMHRQQ